MSQKFWKTLLFCKWAYFCSLVKGYQDVLITQHLYGYVVTVYTENPVLKVISGNDASCKNFTVYTKVA